MEILLFEALLFYISMKYSFHNNLYELILKYVFEIPFLYIIIISKKSLTYKRITSFTTYVFGTY